MVNIQDIKKLEKKDKWDCIHASIDLFLTTAPALIGAPAVGDASSKIFNLIFEPPLVNRQYKLLYMFFKEQNELKNEIDELKLENLLDNPMFITAMMQALHIAIRNHQEEKLNALKNAVLNSALSNSPEDDIQIMFLSYIDSFTVRHMKLLRFYDQSKSERWEKDLSKKFDHQDQYVTPDGQSATVNGQFVTEDPEGKFSKIMRFKLGEILGYEFEDATNENSYLYQQILNDLVSKSMIPSNLEIYAYSSNDHFRTKLDTFGKLFIKYISPPTID